MSKNRATSVRLSVLTTTLLLCVLSFSTVHADVIIDNGNAGTSYTGSWPVSGATNFYGTKSVWARDGATYTWQFSSQPSGNYEVFMWWSGYPSRAASVPVVISHGNGQQALTINQQLNAGKWNSLGQYSFAGSGSVKITAAYGSTLSTCADAVWFKQVSSTPPSEVIIDNRNAATTSTGTWGVSGAPGWYGADSVWARDGATFTWRFSPPQSGNYDLSMWWTQWPSRATNIPVAIQRVGGTTTVPINQQTAGGQWNTLGVYTFQAGTTYNITITSQAAPASTCADAVKFTLTGANPVSDEIIDNGDPETSSTGSWPISGATNPYGANSVYSRDGATYTWTFSPTASGYYAVYLWWTTLTSRSPNVPVDVSHAYGTAKVYVNQQKNGGVWNSIGNYAFQSGQAYRVTVTARAYPASTAADAIKFVKLTTSNAPPAAFIDSTSPNPVQAGGTVSFVGHGADVDGTVAAYSWDSNRDGHLGDQAATAATLLTEGTHLITFKVRDNSGLWSAAATKTVVVGLAQPVPLEFTIDNRDPETAYTGSWSASGAPSPYATDSVWSRDGSTYSWIFSPPVSGDYRVYGWWTQLSSRSTSVPVEIDHAAGSTTASTNQQRDGGHWNLLGTKSFQSNSNYTINVTSQSAPSTTSADAFRFELIYDHEPRVNITSPNSYYLQTSPDLAVKADGNNVQSGWAIKFVIDQGKAGERVSTDSIKPYEALFAGLSKGEHSLDAFVVDQSGNEIQGLYTHDQRLSIGIGDYYVSIGDSITKGYADDDLSDDASADGRNTGGGYEPRLNTVLTAQQGFPQTIANEGVNGATTSDGLALLPAVLAKHPGAKRYLLQYGTNDAAMVLPRPSGQGLSEGDAGYSGSFKDNMQRMINAIRANGKEVCLAKAPVALGDSTDSTPYTNPQTASKNVLIRAYNLVIDELVDDPANNISCTPPDFYAYFSYCDTSGHCRYEDEYADNLHPNGVGYRSMADLWLQSITQ
jgi:lysophospholipase L1-like esterase